MQSRTPTKAEAAYGYLCQFVIGCIACRLDGREMTDPNESWIAFHHNTDKGSKDPGCHFYAMGLCVSHHQGINNYRKAFLVRHGQQARFTERYGNDYDLGWKNWRLIQALPDEIRTRQLQHDIMQHCPFDDLRLAA